MGTMLGSSCQIGMVIMALPVARPVIQGTIE